MAGLSPQRATLPGLTGTKFRNALADLFGAELPTTPLEPDTNPYLFYSIGAASTSISELGVQQLEEAANETASAVFDDPDRRMELVGCEPAEPGDSCVEGFLARFGRRAFRRPLSAEESGRWLKVAVDLSEGDAWLGLRTAVSGMLQSPHFFYRAEIGEPDPDEPERLRLTGFEIATRLSFLLWNSIPDDALLDAAERGELSSASGIEAEARRMLLVPRARDAVQDFFAQYFDLSRLDGLTRNPDHYPQFTATLPESMRTEVRLLVDDLVNRRDADMRTVFSTRRTFVNSELASLYGVEAPDASPVAFVPVELPVEGPRAGLLTLGAFLAMNAHESETSPTLRGKYVRERVLCETVPPPPDNVDIDLTPKEGEPPKTLRERLEEHRENPTCAACHSYIDPPGFLFENFDSVGAYRTEENGYPIDATGDLDGKPLTNARDLAMALANDTRVGRCIVTQLYRHAHGRLDDPDEKSALREISERFAQSSYRFRELLVAMVTHASFRVVAQPESAQQEVSP
jgi:hypothetical protein